MAPELAADFSPEADAGGTVGKPVDPHALASAELQFGRPPKRDPSVTYQPDVLIMEHGDAALRSMESNGIISHFAADAPQVDQIVQGKIIFATERCVGRVGAVKRNDIAVVLEPVQLTDIIQQGHFVYNQPLDLNSVVVAPVPDIPVQFKQDVPGGSAPRSISQHGPKRDHRELRYPASSPRIGDLRRGDVKGHMETVPRYHLRRRIYSHCLRASLARVRGAESRCLRRDARRPKVRSRHAP